MSQSIGHLIRHNYIRSALVPILVIEVMLIILYFSINAYVTDKFSALTLQESQNNLQEVIDSKAHNIDLQLNEISRSLQMLRDEQEAILSAPARKHDAEFALSSGGAWVKQKDNGGSAVIVSSRQILTDEVREQVLHTEDFDGLFKSATEYNPRVVATYFTSRYHMTRYYPYFDGIETVLPEDYDINNYNFYYEANPEHNPERKVVWTGAYLDPAGQGWMISGLIPIYRNGEFEGSTGIDVTIDSLVSNILNLKLPYNASAFFLDAEGTVLAMPEQVEKILGMKELKSHDYKESIERDVLKPEDFNLLKHHNPEIQAAVQGLIRNNQDRTYFQHANAGYYLYKSPISLTGWNLLVLAPEEAIRGAVHKLEATSNLVGYLAVIGMLLFYLVFFLYLFRNARQTAQELAQPVITLAASTEQLGKSVHHTEVKLTGIDELDQLATRFNGMAKELSARTEQLILSEIQRRENQRRANTDYLTGLFNRRYFMETVQAQWLKPCENSAKHCLMAIDIDHFKKINDTYGHDIGDEVLIGCSNIIKSVVADHGLLARMGGEEFSVYCQRSEQEMQALAEEIRHSVAQQKFSSHNLSVTLSIGLYAGNNLDFNEAYTLADKALYAAKNGGRNQVISSASLPQDGTQTHCA